MKLFAVCCLIFAFIGSFSLSAQTLSGNLDTKFGFGFGAGDSPDFFYSAEEYANLRLKIPAGEYAVIYSAFNLTAAAGFSAKAMGAGVLGVSVLEENYAAVMELERLYIQVSGESFGLCAGLFRIPFGYGLAWRPMDFLNPENPLEPDARLRGVLALTASYFPAKPDGLKFLVFAAAPKDPAAFSGEGARAGFSCDYHGLKASVQFLYCFEGPVSYTVYSPPNPPVVLEYPLGIHRAGLSLKAEPGFAAEFFYVLNPDSPAGIEGLAASAGMDYSFFGGKLYLLAEYLFSGSELAEVKSAAESLGNHYLYASGTWKFSDFSSITAGCTVNFNDFSCTSFFFWQYEFFQGMILTFRAYVPLDRDSFDTGKPGQFGPKKSGSYANFIAGLRVKF